MDIEISIPPQERMEQEKSNSVLPLSILDIILSG